MKKLIKKLKFDRINGNNYIYINYKIGVIIIIYINDFFIIGPNFKKIKKLKKIIYTKFIINKINLVQYFVRIRIICNKKKKFFNLY